jgi:hypothetical protein
MSDILKKEIDFNEIVNLILDKDAIVKEITRGSTKFYEIKVSFLNETFLVNEKFVRNTTTGKLSVGLKNNF